MRLLLLISVFLFSCSNHAINSTEPIAKKTSTITENKIEEPKTLCHNVVGVINPKTKLNENYVLDKAIYEYKLDTVAQVKFWRSIMNLHQDSAIVNFAGTRTVVQKINMKEWNQRSDSSKKFYRDSVKLAYNLDSTSRVLITTGKKFFYDFDKTSQNFHNGINCFVENGVDPWFAQAILLIESPNKLQKSNAGAYGPFQLMKEVARLFGLKVNRQIDERADFERSAYASSSLIKRICIPKVHKMLDSLNITGYNEQDLWFRLLVMHAYHAGAYNVQSALFTFKPQHGNMDLIYNLWQAQTARFKNASQNYSQLVLAAMLEMNERAMLAKN
ncbi:MAG: transglycosylase SLT domain-containing protein [Bacteroidetes bacterium]|nr:transglycosylase SLT domain-containing protein [Bacteroidota bacterium]